VVVKNHVTLDVCACEGAFESFFSMKVVKKPSSTVGKLDQAGRPASACTGLYRQKGKKNPGDTGSQPRQLQIRRDI
jgi:hypothetical protein